MPLVVFLVMKAKVCISGFCPAEARRYSKVQNPSPRFNAVPRGDPESSPLAGCLLTYAPVM